MKEIKKIQKYLMDEKSVLQEEIEQYEKLDQEVTSKIEHSSLYVLSVATSTSDDLNIFSPYSKNKQNDLEEENQNLEDLNRQSIIVKNNLNKMKSKIKKLDSYLDELQKFTDKETYFIDSKDYDTIQNVLDDFLEELENLTKEFEKRLKQFVFVDPHRVQSEFRGYKMKMEELTEKIKDCQIILSDNRRKNR